MNTLTTKGIKISAEVFYQTKYSNPALDKYIFAYRITILNQRDEVVQLKRRHWIIKDATGVIREVEGEGVVGKQPVLHPGASHQYTSWCQLQSEIGAMRGTYQMVIVADDESFQVDIPPFQLVAPFKLN